MKTRNKVFARTVLSFTLMTILAFSIPSLGASFKAVPPVQGLIIKQANYSSPFINCLAVIRDSLWLGAHNGVARFDGLTWKFFRGDHLKPDGKYRFRRVQGNVPELGSGAVNSILPQDSYVWLATDSGLVRYQTVTDRWYVYNATNSPLKTSYIQCLTLFADKLIIGTWGEGITIHDPRSDLFTSQVGDGFRGRYILSMAADKFRVCVGTLHQGLNVYSPRDNRWDNITAASGKLPSNRINAITRDNKSFYVGTDKGMVIFNLEDKSTTLITTVNSNLVGNNIKSLYYDFGKGLLYVGTTQGLSVFDGTYWKNYTSGNGLPQDWVTTVIPFRDQIWAGTHDNGAAFLQN